MSYDHKVCKSCGYIGKPKSMALSILKAKCPKCANRSMVGLRSSEGHNILAQKSGQPRTWVDASNI